MTQRAGCNKWVNSSVSQTVVFGPKSVPTYCGILFLVGIIFAESADKHGIPRADALHAVTNADAIEDVPGLPGETTKVFVGHPHPQTDRYIEVIAALTRHGDIRVFHAMELSDLYRDLVE